LEPRRLRGDGIRLACLSNDVLSWSVLLRQRFELDRYIDACTISGAVGARGSRIP
jgi:FMN phosphatase YigB (HAD superfamily)